MDELKAVMRYELGGLSCGLYSQWEDGNIVGYAVTSTSTGKSVVHQFLDVAIEIFHGCTEEIRSRAYGYTA